MSSRVALVLGLIALFADTANAACRLIGTSIGTSHVRAVEDGRTMVLADGRTVRLAGIEVAADDSAARMALASLVLGNDVELWQLGPQTDRYGRVRAFATVAGTGSIEEALLAEGRARVAAKIGNRTCAEQLQATEQKARAGHLGVWAEPAYLVRNADDLAGIAALRGGFAVVQGKIVSVRESGATIYVNFSRHWRDDFTVTVPKRNEPIFTAEGLDLRKLAGRTVRIRGTIEERSGPWVEATRPEQIEMTESE